MAAHCAAIRFCNQKAGYASLLKIEKSGALRRFFG